MYRHAPLYLEWAPEGVLAEGAPPPPKRGAGQKVAGKGGEAGPVDRAQVKEELAPQEEGEEGEVGGGGAWGCGEGFV